MAQNLKQVLDYGPYKDAYDKYNRFIKSYMDQYGYEDIFLFSPNVGRVLMNVSLNEDFAKELETETHHLAGAWQRMKESQSLQFADLKPYAASNLESQIYPMDHQHCSGSCRSGQ